MFTEIGWVSFRILFVNPHCKSQAKDCKDTYCSLYCVSFRKMVGYNVNKQHVLGSNGMHVFSYTWLILCTKPFRYCSTDMIQYEFTPCKALTRVYEPEKQTVLWRFLRKTRSLKDELRPVKSCLGNFSQQICKATRSHPIAIFEFITRIFLTGFLPDSFLRRQSTCNERM